MVCLESGTTNLHFGVQEWLVWKQFKTMRSSGVSVLAAIDISLELMENVISSKCWDMMCCDHV